MKCKHKQYVCVDADADSRCVSTGMYIKETDYDEMYENFDAKEPGSYVRNYYADIFILNNFITIQETPVSTLQKNIKWGVVVPTMVCTCTCMPQK